MQDYLFGVTRLFSLTVSAIAAQPLLSFFLAALLLLVIIGVALSVTSVARGRSYHA